MELTLVKIEKTVSNVIDVTVAADFHSLLYSTDPTSEAFKSDSVLSEEDASNQSYLGVYGLDPSSEGPVASVSALDHWAKDQICSSSDGTSVSLYNLEMLRKRSQDD